MNHKQLELLAKAKNSVVQPPTTIQAFIRGIQVAEGNSPCYQSETAPVCGIEDCLWRDQGCVTGEMPSRTPPSRY